jgi:uncharacterized RDD family membrane protein YckC
LNNWKGDLSFFVAFVVFSSLCESYFLLEVAPNLVCRAPTKKASHPQKIEALYPQVKATFGGIMERVGFGPRFLAALIDGVALMIVMMILGTVFGISMMPTADTSFSLFRIIMTLIPLGYISTEIFQAATPGKQLMKLKIKNQDGTDAEQSILQKRFLIKTAGSLLQLVGAITTLSIFGTVGGLVGLIIVLGCFMVLTDDKQALHDKIAQTAVFKIG